MAASLTRPMAFILIMIGCLSMGMTALRADDLAQILKNGRLRHLGIPYANFVTGSGDGMDVEMIQLFAKDLKVTYEFVETSWDRAITDLTGIRVTASPKKKETQAMVKGDIIACGMTTLLWRKKWVSFTQPTFISQVWVIARADAPIQPIIPGKNTIKDIQRMKQLLSGRPVMGKQGTCLDPVLYELGRFNVQIHYFNGNLNELAPAIMNQASGITLLDLPDALNALEKWPSMIKVIGPLSPPQTMACAVAKSSDALRTAFNRFLNKIRHNGAYDRLIKKYYPTVPHYFPDFFTLMR